SLSAWTGRLSHGRYQSPAGGLHCQRSGTGNLAAWINRRGDFSREGSGFDPVTRLLRKSGQRQWFRYADEKGKRGIRAPGNHFIFSSSQQGIISVEVTADALTIDDSSKGAAEVSHMITFVARLDHEVI